MNYSVLDSSVGPTYSEHGESAVPEVFD